MAPLLGHAQEPMFEAASIKPTASPGRVGPDGARSIGAVSGGRGFEMVDGSVSALIRYAYPTISGEVRGGAPWVYEDRYDIQVRTGRATTRTEREAMLRELLRA